MDFIKMMGIGVVVGLLISYLYFNTDTVKINQDLIVVDKATSKKEFNKTDKDINDTRKKILEGM